MGKLSTELERDIQLLAADARLNIMVHLTEDADWSNVLNRLEDIGLTTRAEAKEIHVLSGEASPEGIRRMAALPSVRLIERDQAAVAQ